MMEKKLIGSVRLELYKEYFKSGYGLCFTVWLILIFVLMQFLFTFSEYWLAKWSNYEYENKSYLFSNLTDSNVTRPRVDFPYVNYFDRNWRLIIYTGIIGNFSFFKE